MEEGSTKNGWDFTSRDRALFTRQQLPTAPTKTALQNVQIEPLWKGSERLLQKQTSTKGSGWISRIRSFISRIAAQQAQLQPRHTNSGTASNRTSLISRSSDQ